MLWLQAGGYYVLHLVVSERSSGLDISTTTFTLGKKLKTTRRQQAIAFIM